MNEQFQQLQAENQTLKAEIYDLSKSNQNIQTTLNQFATEIAKRIGLTGEDANDLTKYLPALDAIIESKTPATDDEEGEG